jgi:hypothetical protein
LAERLLCKERVRSSSLLVSTSLAGECRNRRSRDHPRHHTGPARRAVIEPLIRVLLRSRPPTSGSLGDGRPRVDAVGGPSGPHLNNWIWFGRNEESSISPSSQGNDPDRSRPRLTAWSDAGGGQATKGTGWMPWRQEPMKDVAGCEKLRGVANRL